MAKQFHNVSISVFLKPGETPHFLDALLPLPTQVFLEQQYKNDPDYVRTKIYFLNKEQANLTVQESLDGGPTVMKFTFRKITHTNKIFDTLHAGLSQEDRQQLHERAHELTTLHGGLTIRISKQALEKKTFVLAKKDVVQCTFLLAVYPKNEATIMKCVEALL